jgi:hypothetical protein
MTATASAAAAVGGVGWGELADTHRVVGCCLCLIVLLCCLIGFVVVVVVACIDSMGWKLEASESSVGAVEKINKGAEY